MVSANLKQEGKRTLRRLLPRIEKELEASMTADPTGWQEFRERLQKYFPALFDLYLGLYGTRYDFFYHLEDLLLSLARSWFARPADLRRLDRDREQNPLW